MSYVFRKTTALLLTLCIIAGMTGLTTTAYAEELNSGDGDAAIVANDTNALDIGFTEGDSAGSVTGNLTLPSLGVSGSTFTWQSDTPEVIANDGTVTRPEADAEDVEVTFTAVITYGEAADTKEFTVRVLKEQTGIPVQSDDSDEESDIDSDDGNEKPDIDSDDNYQGYWELQKDYLTERNKKNISGYAGTEENFSTLAGGGFGQSGPTITATADKSIEIVSGQHSDWSAGHPQGAAGLHTVGYQYSDFRVEFGEEWGTAEYAHTSMMKFDLGSIDSSKMLVKAELQLYIQTVQAVCYPWGGGVVYLDEEIYADISGSQDTTWDEDESLYIPSPKTLIDRYIVAPADIAAWKSFDVTDFIKTSGNDTVSFVLAGNQEPSDLDAYEAYEVLFRFYDHAWGDGERTARLKITYAQYANLSNNTVKEGMPAGTLVGALAAHPDLAGPCTFSILSGDADSFEISGDQLLTKRTLDYGEQSDHELVIGIEDTAGNIYSETFTIQVTDMQFISLSEYNVKEGYPVGTLVGTLEAHPDLTGPCTFTILSGDTDSFKILGNQLLTKGVLDYSVQNSYTLVICVEDADGNTYGETFTVQVTEAQQPTGSLTINGGSPSTNDVSVTLSITASDPEETTLQMRFSNDGAQWSAWETYVPAKEWTMTNGGGQKTVYMELKNALGKMASFSAVILLDTTGDGSAQNPYRVSTPEQLDTVRYHLDWHYIQTADIDLSDYGNWTPIGDFSNPFAGSYNGNGFMISGLKVVADSEYAGLFGRVNNYFEMARLADIHLENVQVQCSAQNGLTGGLAGSLDRGEVTDCSSSGSVTGSWRTGGLIGDVGKDGTIIRSSSSGGVAGIRDQMAMAGGLIGSNSGTVRQCSSDSDVTVGFNGFGGGFVGSCSSSSGSTAAIYNSRSGGNVLGENAFTIGGFAGRLDNSASNSLVRMENCYSSGGVTAQSGIKGGLVGQKNTGSETVSNCYFDSDRAGSVSAGGTPLMAEQMKNPANYNEWDFTSTWKTAGNSYPILIWEGINALILVDKNALTWESIKGANEAEDDVTADLTSPLPTLGDNGTSITWGANPTGWINTTTGEVTRPIFSQGDKEIILTATVSMAGGTSQKKHFTVTIKKEGVKELTVINATARSKVYDGGTAVVIEGAQLSGVTPGDDVLLTGHETGIFAQKDVGSNISVTTNMSLSGGHADGYVLVQPTLSADITPKTLSVGFSGVDRAYDGTVTAVVTSADDRISGNVFEVMCTAAFADKNIGVNIPINIADVSLIGPDAANYTAAVIGSTTANITARPLTITADSQSKSYGDADPQLDYQITSGSLAHEDTLSGELIRNTGENVGAYEIKQGTLTAGGNYALTYVPANLTIGKRGLTVAADAKNKNYGDADPKLTWQITSGSLVSGDALSGELTRNTGGNIGVYEIEQGTLTAGDNYDLTYVPANLTIGKRGLTVAADAKNKTYGNADPKLTWQITSGSLAGGDTLSGELIRAPGEEVGNYEIQQGTLTAGGNYALTCVPANLTIGKRGLTVAADAKNKTYGNADPKLTWQITSGSLAGGDTLSGELIRAPGEDAGNYEIQQGTLTAEGNYDLTYVPAHLSIFHAADPLLTITADTGGSDSSDGGGGDFTPTIPPEKRPDQPVEIGVAITPATVSNGLASVTVSNQVITDAIKKAQEEAKKQEKTANGIGVALDVNMPQSASSLSLSLSQNSLQCLVNAGVTSLTINSGIASLGLDLEALKEIQKQSTGNVTITINPMTNLSAAAKKFIGRRPVYDVTVNYIKAGRLHPITSLGKGSATLSFPYTPGRNEAVGWLFGVYVDDKGNASRISDSAYDVNSGSLILSTNHFSVYGVGYAAPIEKYTDISSHWAKESIDYVVGRGLFSGITEKTFSPNMAMDRGMLVTALGRLAGADVSTYKTSSFSDVAAGRYYLPYVEWAYQKGIISGIGNGKFAPERTVTREEVALVLQNYAKATGYKLPMTREAITFVDASSIGSSYTAAVRAMQQAGIMMGENGNRFNPNAGATRAESAAMLHRYVKLTIAPATAQGWAVNDAGQWLCYKDGKPLTGWQNIGSKRYYFTKDSLMVSGKWLEIGGKWYYFYADGSLAKSTKAGGYEIAPDGAGKTK